MSLIYSFVARQPSTVLADYTAFSGNFATVAVQCLSKTPSHNSKFTYSCDGHTFNYLVDDGFCYLVVADEAAGRQLPFACLNRIKDEFNRTLASTAHSALAHSLNKQFGPKLKEHMEYSMSHPEQLNPISNVQRQVEDVKGIMMDNIEKVLDRGEKIELLVDKTDQLRYQADNFHRTGRSLRRKMWMQNVKFRVMLVAILLIVLYIILALCCGADLKSC